MGFFRRNRLFEPTGDGAFEVRLAPGARRWIVDLADQLEELLTADTPDTTRLFPTAYPDHPELDAGYQILARDELIDQRREAIGLLRTSADADEVSADELSAWMGIVNDLRLVLGTRLDVSEDDVEVDLDGPDADAIITYHQLGVVLAEIVDALRGTLPPPDEDRRPPEV